MAASGLELTLKRGEIYPKWWTDLGATRNHARIQVIDTGKGIDSEFLPHVFEYFRQEDSKTTRKFGGLGLGLAIVRQIVELHGDTVSVDSLGEGQGYVYG
jgi:signal transduction histidine kinase